MDEAREIVVDKGRRTLSLVAGGAIVSAFPVLVGREPGPKSAEGDGRTPEGRYSVLRLLPDEAAVGEGFHKGLHLSYPSEDDADRGMAEGRIGRELRGEIVSAHRDGLVPPQESPLGGYVAIHGGLAPDEPFERGTAGCVVMRSEDMDQVYAFARAGTPVLILP